MEPPDDIDDLLAGHLKGRLDPQRGRALAAFGAAVAREQRSRNRRRLFATLAAFASVAAAAAIAFYAGNRPAVPSKPTPQVTREVAQAEPEDDGQSRVVEQSLAWRTLDEGIILLTDDRPVRRMRQQVIEHVRVYDAEENTYVELTRPREDVFYVAVQTY